MISKPLTHMFSSVGINGSRSVHESRSSFAPNSRCRTHIRETSVITSADQLEHNHMSDKNWYRVGFNLLSVRAMNRIRCYMTTSQCINAPHLDSSLYAFYSHQESFRVLSLIYLFDI